jgi:hypothetical protein
MTTLTIKSFTVLDTDSGKMQLTGQSTSTQINNILSQEMIIDNTTEQTAVDGTPDAISSGNLVGNAHMCTSYIKIVSDYQVSSAETSIYAVDNFIRLTYLGGTTSASNSLLYGFAATSSTAITDITWTVAIAKNTSQTAGDYLDIEFPDRTHYPNLYIAFILVNAAWDNRTIVSGNLCSITNVDYENYCINSSKSLYDVDESHFIISCGINTTFGIFSRITFGCEDWEMSTTDRDYNDLKFSIASKAISESLTNDTSIS